jgi:integrase
MLPGVNGGQGMATKLTAATVGQAKAGAVRREIPDGGCAGLYLVVQPNGAKSWAVRYRSPIERDGTGNRKAKKFTLGPLLDDGAAGEPKLGSPLGLADARALAIEALRKVRHGHDPARDYRAETHAARAAASNFVEDVFADFMAKHVRKRKGKPIRESTRLETGRLLGLVPDGDLTSWKMRTPKSGVLAQWAGREVRSITKRDVLDLMDKIVAGGAPVGANRTLAALKTAFAWCVKRDILATSPCDHVDDPSPENSSERELSGIELTALWRAAEEVGYPYGRMVQLLVLTGQRRDEVRAGRRGELDLASRMFRIPGDRTKNGREHHVPLSDSALAILEELPNIKSKAGYLFTIAGEVPVSNLSRRKRRLDKAMLAELQKIDPDISELQPWKLHHLRHTLKTWMQRARIPKDVRNAVQNHIDGDMDELCGHYSFEKEKRDALDRWARHVAELESGANVVALRRG